MRVSELDGPLERLAELIRARPAGHRRAKPDTRNVSRPELEVLDRGAALEAAIARRQSDTL